MYTAMWKTPQFPEKLTSDRFLAQLDLLIYAAALEMNRLDFISKQHILEYNEYSNTVKYSVAVICSINVLI